MSVGSATGSLQTLRRHWLIWSFFFFANGMLPLVNTIEGSFARSLIYCADSDSGALESGTNETVLFSGSAHCADRLRVINEGQLLSSFAQSAEGVAKIAMMLAAVVLIDVYGRRTMLLAGLSCTALSVLLFVIACCYRPWAHILFVAGQALQGAFPVELLCEQVAADLAVGMSKADAMGIFEMQGLINFLPVFIFGFVASLIQVLELHDYTALWSAVLAVNGTLLFLAASYFPETRVGGPSHASQAGIVAGMRHELREYGRLFADTRRSARLELVMAHVVCLAISSGRFSILTFSWNMSYFRMTAAGVILRCLPIIFIHTACTPVVRKVVGVVGMRPGYILISAYKAAVTGLFLLQPFMCWTWFLQYYLSSLVSGWDALTKTMSTEIFKERFNKYMALSTLFKHAAIAIASPMYALSFDAKASSYVARLGPGSISFAFYSLAMLAVFHPRGGVWAMFCQGLDVMQAESDLQVDKKTD